jgi:peptidoglycan/LPS O-acetylase OafA/YrhL
MPGRFRSLDAVRGVAALSVVLFHCVNSHPQVNDSAIGRVLMNGWAGVFLFFPVSGYCICAAMHRAENASPGRFLRRRWKRIYPPYLASVIVSVAVAVMALPFNRGSGDDLVLTVPAWLSILTLTQVFTPYVGRINPVYWSLCYEEQFYLVMALALWLAAPRHRAALLTAITAIVVVCETFGWAVMGLFIDYWLAFAFGIGVYLWLREPRDRFCGAAILALGVVHLIQFPDLSTSVSLVCAALMMALARVDDRIAASHAARPLLALGLISYSLYLIHVPIAGRLVNILIRMQAPVWLGAVVGPAASIACAALFFRFVERRFLVHRRGTIEAGDVTALVTAPLQAAGGRRPSPALDTADR